MLMCCRPLPPSPPATTCRSSACCSRSWRRPASAAGSRRAAGHAALAWPCALLGLPALLCPRRPACLPSNRAPTSHAAPLTSPRCPPQSFELPKALHVECRPFTVDNDLLTPTFELRRAQLLRKYEAQVGRLESGVKERRGEQRWGLSRRRAGGCCSCTKPSALGLISSSTCPGGGALRGAAAEGAGEGGEEGEEGGRGHRALSW